MISVAEATAFILQNTIELSDVVLPLPRAWGQVLREPLIADRDFPPYHRITMDGIAIKYQAYASGQRQFPVAGVAAAGAPKMELANQASCLEVMTGAILPGGTDTVIRYEDLAVHQQLVTIKVDQVRKGQNIHWQGTDRKRGDVVVQPGQPVSAAEVGVAATIGKTQLRVTELPKAMIISTGDELVEIHQIPLPHQIRKSNVHRIRATLQALGIAATTAHLQDDEESIRAALAAILEEYPFVILSGGVSKGKFDFIPDALEALGVKKLFHRIAQRPGKPFWFGRYRQNTCVFALPGNPVSSFMCTLRYILPWIRACQGLEAMNYPYAQLTEDYRFLPDLTYFLQVKTHHTSDGMTLARPVTGHGSGDLANLVDADGFLELPRGRNVFNAGEVFPYITYR